MDDLPESIDKKQNTSTEVIRDLFNFLKIRSVVGWPTLFLCFIDLCLRPLQNAKKMKEKRMQCFFFILAIVICGLSKLAHS